MTNATATRLGAKDDAPALVRQAEARDAAGLIALINALAHEAKLLFVLPIDPANGGPTVVQYLDAMRASGNSVVLVAECAGELVGLATGNGGAHPSKRGVVEIGIGVRATHQGIGLGRALLSTLEKWAEGAGLHRLQLPVVTSNEPALALYRRQGFTVEGVLRDSVVADGHRLDQFMMAKLIA
jgi:RimJ/RimL family protein N-acetyltransferase